MLFKLILSSAVAATVSSTALLSSANAEGAAPDLKAIKFTGEIASKTSFQLKFHAPAGHHFNQEAPAKVELVNDAQPTTGKIDKSLQTMTVDFPAGTKPSANCSVKANLFVCNEGNSYCLPVRQEFDCVKLQAKN